MNQNSSSLNNKEANKCVFVGNIPYDSSEQALINIFKTVGRVISFRLVSDRDTGKPKGYGFCEFEDAETAMCAIRNLNNYEFFGRPLRVDKASAECTYAKDNPNFNTETGQFMYSKQKVEIETPMLSDAIVNVVKNFSQNERVEILTNMKVLIEQDPLGAECLLNKNPSLGQALLIILILFGFVTAEDIKSLQSNATKRLKTDIKQLPTPNTEISPNVVNIPEVSKNLSNDQKQILKQVLKLSQSEIDSLPAEIRHKVRDLQNQMKSNEINKNNPNNVINNGQYSV